MFPSAKNINVAALPEAKNPNRFGAKNRWQESKLEPLQKIIQRRLLNHRWRKLCANYMSLKKFADWFQSRRPSACRVCPHAVPPELVRKTSQQTNSSINTACSPQLGGFGRYLRSAGSGQRLHGAPSSDREAPSAPVPYRPLCVPAYFAHTGVGSPVRARRWRAEVQSRAPESLSPSLRSCS